MKRYPPFARKRPQVSIIIALYVIEDKFFKDLKRTGPAEGLVQGTYSDGIRGSHY